MLRKHSRANEDLDSEPEECLKQAKKEKRRNGSDTVEEAIEQLKR